MLEFGFILAAWGRSFWNIAVNIFMYTVFRNIYGSLKILM